MAIKIVVPGDLPTQIGDSPELDRLRRYGEVVVYRDRPSSAKEQVARAEGATCIINSRGAVRWPGEILELLPELRMIAVCGIGTDSIDLDAAKRLGIRVCNLPGRTAPIVAEHAFAIMLAVAHRAWFQTDALKRGIWDGSQNISLRGKTIGLVGAGNIGAEMARLASAFGMRVTAWSYNPSPDRARRLGVEFLSLDELLAGSDVVSVHVKASAESRHLIGRRELGMMRKGAILVNTARASIIDTEALISALNSGHLGGAAIDVFDSEPLGPDHPILSCRHVVLTPHNADQTPEGMALLNSGCVDNVIAFLEDRPINAVV